MKGIMTICVVAALFAGSLTGCKDGKGNGKLDPNAKVYINGNPMPQSSPQLTTKAGQQLLTPREVVKQAQRMSSARIEMGIDDWNRDTINNRIVGSSTFVVAQNGTLETDLISSRNVILVTLNEENRAKDTIAYIKNSVMEKAEGDIRAAYDREDYTACYKLFDDAFVFIPTTGAEYKELQKQGNN